MSTFNVTINLSDEQHRWIQDLISAGRYATANEYFLDLINLDRAGVDEVREIRAALLEGETSGHPVSIDPAQFKKRMVEGNG